MRRGILADRKDLRALADRIARRPFVPIYEALRKRCALILESWPITETQWWSLWEHGQRDSATVAARASQGRILDLIVAHHVDRNLAYRDRAVEELKSLVGWTAWVDPCHPDLSVDPCTVEAAVATVVALDWLWEDLDPALRDRAIGVVREKVIQPYLKSVEQQVWWHKCCHNWNAVINGGCGLAALAFADDDADARRAYEFARAGLRDFLAALGPEGGWDEGVGYWGYAMRYLLLLGQAACRLEDDQTIFHSRGMDRTGLFPIYFTPNGHSASFGDAPCEPLYGTFYLFARHFGLSDVTWWLDTYSFHRDVSTTGWSMAGLAMLFRPPELDVPPEPKLEPVKVFEQIGWGAVADRWPRPSLYLAAKAGDLSASHSHRDMNSIQLQVDGEMVLTNHGGAAGAREGPSEAGRDSAEAQAPCHNTITIGGRDHQLDAQGGIVDRGNDPRCRWLVLDAGGACGEDVRFHRHAVMLLRDGAGTAAVILDELKLAGVERVDLHWHTPGRVEFDAAAMAGTIALTRTAVHFAVAGTMKLTGQVEGRDVNGRTTGRSLHATGRAGGRALLVSVFSRQPLAGPVVLTQSDDGDVHMEAADAKLHFRAAKGRLRLATVGAR